MVVALISGGVLAYSRMRVDIFPSLNVPKIYVFLDYVGMSPDQIEGFIVNQLELYFQYVDGIQDINTRNIQQVALCELSFFPGTDMGQAMAQVVAMSDRAMSWMPKGTLPPMIMRMDAGSVPVGYLVFESKKTSLGAMGDLAQNVVRPLVQKFVPGTVAISPFGPNMRSIVVSVDPHKLLRLQPDAPDRSAKPWRRGTTSFRRATSTSRTRCRWFPTTPRWSTSSASATSRSSWARTSICATWPRSGRHRHHLRLCPGQRQEVGLSADHQEGHRLDVDGGGRHPQVHEPLFQRRACPKDVYGRTFEFDESPTVVAAVESVATEGLIGAGLTGLMILLFLRDLRSVIVVVLNIPLALLGSLFGLCG